MAATAEEKANLAKRLKEAGADPEKAEKFAGGKQPEKAAAQEGSKTPAEKAADPPAPKSKKLPSITAGNMGTNKAQRIIFGIMIGVTGLTIIGDVTSGEASVTDAIPRRIASGTIAGIMLMLLAIPVPRVASSLAGVIAIAALFVNPNGQKVLTAISKIGGSSEGDKPTGVGKGVPSEGVEDIVTAKPGTPGGIPTYRP